MNKSSVLLLASFLTFSSHANAEWTYLTENESGAKYYIDYDRIIKKNGYTYYWHVINMSEPDHNIMSWTSYYKVECASPRRYMPLQIRGYDQHFGMGNYIATESHPEKWSYPQPQSRIEGIINYICSL